MHYLIFSNFFLTYFLEKMYTYIRILANYKPILDIRPSLFFASYIRIGKREITKKRIKLKKKRVELKNKWIKSKKKIFIFGIYSFIHFLLDSTIYFWISTTFCFPQPFEIYPRLINLQSNFVSITMLTYINP